MSERFSDTIKKWVYLNKKQEELQKEITSIKNKKKELEKNIIPIVQVNNIQNKNISFDNNIVYFPITKIYPSLTLKLITEALDESFIDETKKQKILEQIALKKIQGVKNSFNIRCKIKK